jgi:hypothetical protein
MLLSGAAGSAAQVPGRWLLQELQLCGGKVELGDAGIALLVGTTRARLETLALSGCR